MVIFFFQRQSNTLSPFPCWVEPGAGIAVPSTVRVSGEAAVGTGRPVNMTAVQGNLGDPFVRAHVQLLLFDRKGRDLFQALRLEEEL